MKLVTVQYFGYAAMDRRFSSPMLPWIVSEIRKRDTTEQLCLGAEDGTLQAYNIDFELQFTHKLQDITRFSQADTDPTAFLYLVRDDTQQLLYCHLFQALRSSDVTDLWQQMREQTTLQHVRSASLSGLSHMGSGGGASDISPSSSHFFEVLYIGKIKVSNKKVPDTFIDDTLEKFRAHDLEKTRHRREAQLQAAAPATSREDLRRGSQDSTASESGSWDSISLAHAIQAANADHSDDSKSWTEPSHPQYHHLKSKRMSIDTNVHSMYAPVIVEQQHAADQSEPGVETARRGSVDVAVNKEDEGKVAAPKAGKPGGESHQHNRTMVLQVGRTDLRLISPDRKQVLLHKQHCNVVRCVQGQRSSDHFGIVCKEAGGGETAGLVGYILRCESSAVTADAVAAISQASTWIEHKSGPFRTSVTSCEHCPMLWYHKLCADVEPLSDRKTQAVIFRRIDQLDEPEQTSILTKFRGAETHSIRDQNEFLMMLLRAHCEQKQSRHVHDTAETRSEFLSQYLGGGGASGAPGSLFMKARRSLSNSFDHLLKRKGSKDDFGAMGLLGGGRDLTLPLGQAQGSGSEGRPRSHTIGSQSELKDMSGGSTPTGENPDEDIKSPMMDIFMKVGSAPRTPPIDSTDSGQPETPTSLHSSWRQAIFNRVVTPNKSRTSSSSSADNQGTDTSSGGAGEISPSKRSSAELRALWRQAIKQAILLVRMEKENNRLRVRQEETAIKRLKLEYEDLASPAGAPPDFSSEHLELQRPSQALLRATALHGIPRPRRGDIWRLLQGPRHENHVHINLNQFIHYYTPYESLLKQLTSHQHAILIDLGRTFPTHKYFSTPLGPGQLALFNLLKAYSLLDPEVGYCQGLSFVAGVLLLHLDEPDAFSALKHLMFVRGLRDQYLPDMGALQVKLYQLSRLVHDRLPDLYRHFDQHEVCTTLYAAPWMLTLFASQFPLGFVARVFDLVFLDSPSAIFRVALALLEYNKEKLLECESFEEIMECLKGGVACLDTPEKVEGVMGAVYKLGDEYPTDDDMEHKLHEYRGEYQVLQEESATTRGKCAEIKELRARVARLEEENRGVRAQFDIAGANVQRLERIRAMQQATINRLEMQCRGLEVSVITLGTYLDDLIDRRKLDIQVPGDVRRIVSQLMLSERRKTSASSNTNNAVTDSLGAPSSLTKTLSSGAQLFRRASPGPGGRVMVKSLSTGLLSVNNATAQEADATARATSLESQAELGKILRSSQLAKNVMSLPEKGIGLRVINTEEAPDSSKPAQGGSNTITKPSRESSPQQHIGSNNRVFIKSLSNPNLGTKVSNFFSNSHNQILQQHRGDLGPMLRSTSMSNSIKQIIREDSRENLQQYERSMSSDTDTSRTSTDTESGSNKDGTTSRVSPPFIKSRSNSLTPTRDFNYDRTNSSNQNITDQTFKEQSKTPAPTELCPKECISNNSTSSAQVSPTESIDSGVGVTPQSPDMPAHPLSGCDVNFTYNGTTKLKTIRSLRNLSRNSSPDLLGK